MATVHRRFTLNTSADSAWQKIRATQNVHKLFDMLVDAEVDGDKRVCRTADGGELVERIITVDDDARRIVYTITDSPFDFEFHSASWQVYEQDGKTVFEWYTDVKPDPVAEMLIGVIDGEKDNIVAGLSS